MRCPTNQNGSCSNSRRDRRVFRWAGWSACGCWSRDTVRIATGCLPRTPASTSSYCPSTVAARSWRSASWRPLTTRRVSACCRPAGRCLTKSKSKLQVQVCHRNWPTSLGWRRIRFLWVWVRFGFCHLFLIRPVQWDNIHAKYICSIYGAMASEQTERTRDFVFLCRPVKCKYTPHTALCAFTFVTPTFKSERAEYFPK